MNILITDDEKLIVDDLTHEVHEIYPSAVIDAVTNAEEALVLSDGKEYDIALLDIDMPGMNGLTLARKLIAAQPAVNIIFVTGYQEYALEAHDLYCSAFLLKPIGKRKLKTAFENLRRPFIDVPSDLYSEHYSGGAVIGKRIKMYREMRGISRQELANYMNVTRQTVFRWEQGERIPDVLTFTRLARLLGIGIEDILKEKT